MHVCWHNEQIKCDCIITSPDITMKHLLARRAGILKACGGSRWFWEYWTFTRCLGHCFASVPSWDTQKQFNYILQVIYKKCAQMRIRQHNETTASY